MNIKRFTWREQRPLPLLILLIWVLACPLLLFADRWPVAAALTLLGLLGLWLVAYRLKENCFPITPFNSYFLFYLVLSALAFWFSPLAAQSLRRLLVLLLGLFGTLAAFDWANTPARQLQLAHLLGFAGGCVAVLGLFAAEWPTRYVIPLEPITRLLPHLSGSLFIHHNELAGTLLLLMPLSLACWRQASTQQQRLLWAILNVLLLLVLLLTQSRSAWVGLVVALLAWRGWGKHRWRALGAVLAIVWGIPPLLSFLPRLAWQTAGQSLQVVDIVSKTGGANSQSWLARLEMWSVAGQMLHDYPVFGAGLYTFEAVSRANYLYHVLSPTFQMSHAHNLLLQTAVSLGWAGLVTLLGLWTTVLAGLWAAAATPEASPTSWLVAPVAASVVGYLNFNTFDVLALEQRPSLFVWLLLALAARLVLLQPSRWMQWLRWLPLPFFVLLCLTPLAARNLAYLALDRARLTPETPLAADLEQQLRSDNRRLGLFYELRGERLAAQQSWQHDSEAPQFLLAQGRWAAQQGEMATAVDWYTLALTLRPTLAEASYWRGVAYQAMNERVQARASYQQALEGEWGEEITAVALQAQAYASYGQILAEEQEWSAAASAFTQAVRLAPTYATYSQQLWMVEQQLKEQKK